MQLRRSNWWIKSKDLGKVSVGLEGTATSHVLDDADGANTRNFYDAEADGVYQGAFFIRSNSINTGIRWNQALRGSNYVYFGDISSPGPVCPFMLLLRNMAIEPHHWHKCLLGLNCA